MIMELFKSVRIFPRWLIVVRGARATTPSQKGSVSVLVLGIETVELKMHIRSHPALRCHSSIAEAGVNNRRIQQYLLQT